MAITNKEQGVWKLNEVYNKINEGGIWSYTADPMGGLWSWGAGGPGALGLNTVSQVSSPTQVGTYSGWNFLAKNDSDAYTAAGAIKKDGTLWTWGNNDNGSLGLNNQTQRSSPAQVGTDTTWNMLKVVGGPWGTMRATKTDGTAWVWGANQHGSLGINQPTDYRRSSPVALPGTTWKNFFRNGAVKTDGTLWSWGNNTYGQLGLNTARQNPSNLNKKSSPTQVGTNTTWAIADAGNGGQSFAVKTDGTLWAWGRYQFGILGHNNQTDRSSPTQVGTDTTWGATSNKIDANSHVCVAIKTDNTLWAWGYNIKGQLGLNEGPGNDAVGSKSSPCQVGTDTNWNSVSGTYYGTIASKTDGTLWSWGTNNDGSLGLNQANGAGLSSPTQIPGAWIDPTNEHALAMQLNRVWAIRGT